MGIISDQIDWVKNGELADEVNLNRPLKEVVAIMEKDLVTSDGKTTSDSVSVKYPSTMLGSSVPVERCVYIDNTGKFQLADASDDTKQPLGYIKNAERGKIRLFTSGEVKIEGNTLTAGEKYYLTNDGNISTTKSNVYLGVASSQNTLILSSDSNNSTYNKTQIDDFLTAKANANATVNLTDDQTIAGTKKFSSPVVVPDATATTHAVNLAQLNTKANQATTYTKTEVDNLINTKATKLLTENLVKTVGAGGDFPSWVEAYEYCSRISPNTPYTLTLQLIAGCPPLTESINGLEERDYPFLKITTGGDVISDFYNPIQLSANIFENFKININRNDSGYLLNLQCKSVSNCDINITTNSSSRRMRIGTFSSTININQTNFTFNGSNSLPSISTYHIPEVNITNCNFTTSVSNTVFIANRGSRIFIYHNTTFSGINTQDVFINEAGLLISPTCRATNITANQDLTTQGQWIK